MGMSVITAKAIESDIKSQEAHQLEIFRPQIEKQNSEGIKDGREINLPEAKKPDVEVIRSYSIQQLVEENKSKFNDVKENLVREEDNWDSIECRNPYEKVVDGNIDGTKLRHIPTINEGMVGQGVNGVEFARRKFTLNGENVEGVFPVFVSELNIKLPENLYKASDNEQMRYCTKKLAEEIERDPEFAKKFTPRQLEQIRNGEPRISGLTWHHSEIPGKMQLVDANDHSAARHTGGRSIWGGGSENR